MEPNRRSHALRAAAALGLAAGLATALAVVRESGGETLPHSLEIWDNAARLALPLWLVLWLGLLISVFAASLLFVRRQRAARWALGGLLTSHALVVLLEFGDLATLRTGLVSTTHVIGWLPAWFALLRDLPGSADGSRYGLWLRSLLVLLSIALVFDLRDAGLYLYYQLAGHPALPPA